MNSSQRFLSEPPSSPTSATVSSFFADSGSSLVPQADPARPPARLPPPEANPLHRVREVSGVPRLFNQPPPSLASSYLSSSSSSYSSRASLPSLLSHLPPKYSPIFPYPSLNKLQQVVLPVALNSDSNIAVCAPTGSGKTTVFEMALVRLMEKAPSGGR